MIRPESLFWHLFGEDKGFLVTFTGEQGRLRRADARHNELTRICQRSWRYPAQAEEAAQYLVDDAQLERDAYFAVHLFREYGNRRSDNAMPTVRALWCDEDDGCYPGEGPEPTAILYSSSARRQLYWLLTQDVAIEWAAGLNRRIALWAGADTSKARATAVLRPPGTANYKRCPKVDLVVGELTGSGPWEPEVMDQAIPPIPEPEAPPRPRGPYTGPELALAPYLQAVEVLGEVPDTHGVKFRIVCPWSREHSHGDRSGTRLGKRSSGALWFHCDHAHCQGRGWPEFKAEVIKRWRSPVARRGGITIEAEAI